MINNIMPINIVIGCIIIVIIILYLNFRKSINCKIVEPLKENTYVVLIGDSIFDNKDYAQNSIERLLTKQHKKTLVIAKDNATIKDISKQINEIPIYYDKTNTKLIISVGGNDLLNKYVYKMDEYKDLDDIFDAYRSIVTKVKKLNYNIVLCNIYYPPYKEIKPYHKIIKQWNDKLMKYAYSNNFELLKIDDILRTPKDFSNYIEPSSIGGIKIVNKIIKLN